MEVKGILQVSKMEIDPLLARAVAKLERQARSPMGRILARIPGDSIQARAEQIGISRQTYYNLLSGRNLPRKDLIEQLANLTGYSRRRIKLAAAAARAALVSAR